MTKQNRMNIETLLNLFMIDKGKLNVFLVHKLDEPYKNYWMLPNKELKLDEDSLTCITNITDDLFAYSDMYLKEIAIFSNPTRIEDSRVVGISYLGLVDPVTANLKFNLNKKIEGKWFSIDNLPKMAYDHNLILKNASSDLKDEIIDPRILKVLYPSDFTLAELQRTLEKLLGISIDRRNFRKKLINKNWIKQTGNVSEGKTGRPGKLYYFNDEFKSEKLF